MNRRAFLKSVVGIAAIAALPIPLDFSRQIYIDDGTGFEPKLKELMKSLEAGSYNPGALSQGCALQVEDLSAVMNCVTFDDTHIKLHKVTNES
jgi:hypothetical protein